MNFLLCSYFSCSFLSYFLWNSLAWLHHAIFDDCSIHWRAGITLRSHGSRSRWRNQILLRGIIHFHSTAMVRSCNILIPANGSHVHQDHLLDLCLWHLFELAELLLLLDWVAIIVCYDMLSGVLVEWADPMQFYLRQVDEVCVWAEVWFRSLTVQAVVILGLID